MIKKKNNVKIKNKRIKFINLNKKNMLYEGHTSIITCIELTRDGKYIVSGSQDSTIRL